MSQKKVIQSLREIVNNKQPEVAYKKNADEILLKVCNDTSYTLVPNPTTKHPGNGFVKTNRTSIQRSEGRPYSSEMVNELKLEYKENCADFVKDIDRLFYNNEKIDEFPFVTAELYMLLNFEIARRQVEKKESVAEAFDQLPIGETIEKILFLMKMGKCSFEDVFLNGKDGFDKFCENPEAIEHHNFEKGGRFHFFSHDSPEYRRNRIDAVNKMYEEIEDDFAHGMKNLKVDEKDNK